MCINKGTLAYSPPETYVENGKVSEKIDIFAFGVMMNEIWTRKKPYD
jgi:serine/threonine protein kinase